MRGVFIRFRNLQDTCQNYQYEMKVSKSNKINKILFNLNSILSIDHGLINY